MKVPLFGASLEPLFLGAVFCLCDHYTALCWLLNPSLWKFKFCEMIAFSNVEEVLGRRGGEKKQEKTEYLYHNV